MIDNFLWFYKGKYTFYIWQNNAKNIRFSYSTCIFFVGYIL